MVRLPRRAHRAGDRPAHSGGPSVRTVFNPFYKVADNTGSLFMAREELSGLPGGGTVTPRVARL